MGLKFTEKLCVMTMENDTKIEEDLTCYFKIDMRNLASLIQVLGSLQNLKLNRTPSDQRK